MSRRSRRALPDPAGDGVKREPLVDGDWRPARKSLTLERSSLWTVEDVDYIELALSLTRDQFVARCGWPFLVGDDALAKPSGPQPTIAGKAFPEIQRFLAGGPPPAAPVERMLVCPVQKSTTAFPSMITIGRTSNNDVVINDVEVSKFHAFIRQADADFEILDAGSSNGTWVGDRRLKKREPHALRFGEELRFGRLRFVFCDAGRCWDLLRQRRGG